MMWPAACPGRPEIRRICWFRFQSPTASQGWAQPCAHWATCASTLRLVTLVGPRRIPSCRYREARPMRPLLGMSIVAASALVGHSVLRECRPQSCRTRMHTPACVPSLGPLRSAASQNGQPSSDHQLSAPLLEGVPLDGLVLLQRDDVIAAARCHCEPQGGLPTRGAEGRSPHSQGCGLVRAATPVTLVPLLLSLRCWRFRCPGRQPPLP